MTCRRKWLVVLVVVAGCVALVRCAGGEDRTSYTLVGSPVRGAGALFDDPGVDVSTVDLLPAGGHTRTPPGVATLACDVIVCHRDEMGRNAWT